MKNVILVLALALATVGKAEAQDWPNRPVTIVVPFGAGGAMDIIARNIAPRLTELLGQQVVVENVGGAGGTAGVSRVAKAPPDGYQIALGNLGTQVISQTLYKHPLYNSVTDFDPVGMFAQAYFILITRK